MKMTDNISHDRVIVPSDLAGCKNSFQAPLANQRRTVLHNKKLRGIDPHSLIKLKMSFINKLLELNPTMQIVWSCSLMILLTYIKTLTGNPDIFHSVIILS
jgi:hypothetical protein